MLKVLKKEDNMFEPEFIKALVTLVEAVTDLIKVLKS